MRLTKDNIVRQSTKAICAAAEREITVNPKNVNKVKAMLRQKGFMIVGTSERKDKIWFIRRGAGLF